MERPHNIVFLWCAIFFYSVRTYIMYNIVYLHYLFDYTEWFSYLLRIQILLKYAQKHYFQLPAIANVCQNIFSYDIFKKIKHAS